MKYLPKVLGYGVGMTAKEEILSIKEDNDKTIEVGMVFNVRLSLALFDKEQRPERNCLLISDTILITQDGNQVLTHNIKKNYGDISY